MEEKATTEMKHPRAPQITFEMVDPCAPPNDYCSKEEPGSYVWLTRDRMGRTIQWMQDPDMIVIPESSIKVMFDYLLKKAPC